MKTVVQQNTSSTGLFETESFVEHGRASDHQRAKLFSQNQHLQHALSPLQKLGLASAAKNRLPAN